MASPILLLILSIPSTNWKVNGRNVTYQELWASGAGLVFLSMIALVGVGSWGIAARKSEARWALVLANIVPVTVMSLWPLTWFTDQDSYLGFWISSFISAAFMFFLLFRVESINTYFFMSSKLDV